MTDRSNITSEQYRVRHGHYTLKDSMKRKGKRASESQLDNVRHQLKQNSNEGTKSHNTIIQEEEEEKHGELKKIIKLDKVR